MFERIVIAVGSAPEDRLRAAAEALHVPSSKTPVLSFHVHSSRPGDTLDGLLQFVASENADLVVLGATSHVTARRVAMLAPCSVLMVPGTTELSLTRLLVPVDFSEASSEAVREAGRIISSSKTECIVAAVESDDDPWLDWHDVPDKLQDQLDRFVAGVMGPKHPMECLVEPIQHSTMALGHELYEAPRNIEGADIAATIVNVAARRRCSLIVMGTRGRSPAASILIGSVTEKVMQLSPVPVIAVKQHGGRLGLVQGLLERLRGQQPSLVVG